TRLQKTSTSFSGNPVKPSKPHALRQQKPQFPPYFPHPTMSPSLPRLALALATSVLPTTTLAAMGPAFSTGPVADSTFIRSANATLVLPAVPRNNNGVASLWVGMGTSNGDLIQSIAENWNSDSWSVFAYTLLSTSETTQMPVQDDPTEADEGDRVTMLCKFSMSIHFLHRRFNNGETRPPSLFPSLHNLLPPRFQLPCHSPLATSAAVGNTLVLTIQPEDEYQDDSGNYTQTVSLNGHVVSTLSTSDGHAQGWGSAVECAETNCGTVSAHSWIDVSITMDTADPNYKQTQAKGEGVTGELTTSDGGKTWTVGKIGIPEHSF
ncbi:hypothetical protein D0863_05142, partial [Hortaea werneckii]